MSQPKLVACGAVNWDTTLFVPRLPATGEEVTVTELSRVPGGTGANAAVAAARLLGAEQVAFLGAVGSDEIGRVQRSLLEAEGVLANGLRVVPDTESGQAYILVDQEGGNVIASALGANRALGPQQLREREVQELLGSAGVYAVTDPPLEVVEALVQVAADNGARVLWDPGIHVEWGWGVLSNIAVHVETLLLNQVEAERLFGDTAPHAVAKRLLEAGWRNQIVLKRGADGAALIDLASRQVHSTPALPLEALGLRPVSSVGAGDAFLGALAALRVRGYDSSDALVRAACAAGLKVTRPGTRDVPTWDELEATYRRWQALGIDLRGEPIR